MKEFTKPDTITFHCTTCAIEACITRLRAEAVVPTYATNGSAGLDLFAANPVVRELRPGQFTLVPTGWAIAIPPGYEGQVRPRSGLAMRDGITVLNAPGTIDSDYRGEVGVVLVNLGDSPYQIHAGTRIAQLVIAPVKRATMLVVDSLPDTARGSGGFGSTGET